MLVTIIITLLLFVVGCIALWLIGIILPIMFGLLLTGFAMYIFPIFLCFVWGVILVDNLFDTYHWEKDWIDKDGTR